MVRKKRVFAVGNDIGKIRGIPVEVRQRANEILARHESWGPQKHATAADALIRLSAENRVPVSTLVQLLRRSTDLELMKALVKRLEHGGKKARQKEKAKGH